MNARYKGLQSDSFFTMMHKDTPVAKVRFENNVPVQYEDIYNESDIPIGTIGRLPIWQKKFLEEWVKSRAIPSARPGMLKLYNSLGTNSAELFIKNAGISLTDTYWFKTDENIKWTDVNFHTNGFDQVLAEYYLDGNFSQKIKKSPDFTTDGCMEKFWIVSDGLPYLVKMDTQHKNILCANEVVFSEIATQMNVKTTRYYPSIVGNTIGCICKSFVEDPNTDFVTAMQFKFNNYEHVGPELYNYLIRDLGFEKEIREMLTLDCVLHNKDRHEKNFGVLYRDNQPVSFVPPYDNGGILGGTSAGYILEAQELPQLSDADMMIIPWKRQSILEKYGCDVPFDKNTMMAILQSTYEQFNIPEILYEYAKKELEYGLSIYAGYKKSEFIQYDIEDREE